MNTSENNRIPSYLEDNWVFDPSIDLNYDDKLFHIIFGPNHDFNEIQPLWFEPLKKIDPKSYIHTGDNSSIIVLFLEDVSKNSLNSLITEFKNLNIPQDVVVRRYKNYENYQEFKNFSDFENYIQNL